MDLSFEYTANNPKALNNLALQYGFDPSVVAWSEDEHVREEIARLLSHAVEKTDIGGKCLVGLDLSAEKPFDLNSAVFEDLDIQDTKLPRGTNLANARFIGCNLYDVNLDECITE